jgi:hypothetical protein
MRVKELLQLIPEEELNVLAIETQVDHQVKKLSGLIMFQLILFSMINRKRISLRVMEEFLRSSSFRTLSNQSEIDAKYNSLSDRISMIKAEYFEQIFYKVFDRFSKYLGEDDSITRYDSTMVAVSCKLFNWGMKVGPNSKTDKKQLKFTVAMHGSLPSHLEVFSEQIDLAEDVALKKAILNDPKSRERPVVFDRGLKSKKSFEEFSNDEILFVTRCNPKTRYILQEVNSISAKPAGASVTLVEDLLIKLKYDYKKDDGNIYRLIKGRIDESGEEIYFLTNIMEMTSYEVAATYKLRWEIEILFKFLKQELNISHLVSRNQNGVKVMMYMSLITAILIITFRKLNKISSYKIAKLRFSLELENIMIGQIVLLCGGDLDKFNNLYDP